MKTWSRIHELITTNERLLRVRRPKLASALDRLAGLTGFVSVLGPDPRVRVFNRLDHVRRVVGFTAWLCDRRLDLDRDASMLVAWCHDLNRLPFAHNLEKLIAFDQAADFPHFVRRSGLDLSIATINATVGVICKDGTHHSPIVRVVYAADAVAGFIENRYWRYRRSACRFNRFLPSFATRWA